MPRRVEDIISSNHRSIRDMSPIRAKKGEPSTSKAKGVEYEIAIHKVKDPLRYMPITPPALPHQKPRWHFKWLTITLGILVIIAVAGYIASTRYSKATFTIVPKVIPISVNGAKPYIAEAKEASDNSGILSYKLVIIRGAASTTVMATNGAITNTKSAGKVTIYNSFSAQPIRLIVGTRLSGENSLIYRLTSSIFVPGYTKNASGTIVPGKITTGIIADQSGQNYNMSKSDSLGGLKIVAYKGSAKYDSVYARLASDIAGGFSGTKKIINPTTLASTTSALKSQLSANLLAQAKSSVPEEYIMYNTGYITSFSVPVIGDGKPNVATVTEQGTLYAILFPKTALINTLAGSQATALFGSFDYTAYGLESLDVVFNNLKDFSPNNSTTSKLVFHVKGNMKLIASIPVDEIKRKLGGISLAETEGIFRSYNSIIESAAGELLPPWAKVPKDVGRISVVVEKE